MAHFAKLNKQSVVEQVVVVHNDELLDDNGVEQEQLGVEFLQSLFGKNTNWVQTSYNNNFRYNFAGIGYTYNRKFDAFIPPPLSENFVLNTETYTWELPESEA